jgi:cytidine deaminase
MNKLTNTELIEKARSVLRPRKLAGDGDAGDVASALQSKSGNLYLGVCIDVSSGMGFCAEHSAMAAMITAGESEIARIVAVWGKKTVLPPCGRCREFMNQIDINNLENTEVILGTEKAVKLSELLPYTAGEFWNE